MDIRGFFSALIELPPLMALKKGMVPRPDSDRDCIGAAVEKNAERFGDLTAVVSEEEQVTWAELHALANRYAEFLSAS